MKVLNVTGYKSLEMGIFKESDPRIEFIKAAIEKRLKEFIEEGLEWVIVSGQMGVEMWAAEVVQQLQENYPIQLGIFPAFENQANRWPEVLQMKYEELIMTADFYKPLYAGDYRGPFQFQNRNIWFAEKSDATLILIDEEHPGSVQYFYKTAKQQPDYPIYLITPMDLDEIVEEIRMQDPDYWL